MDFEDTILSCRDCQKEFYFTAGEQQFYRERGFIHVPSRCNSCRAIRKAKAAGKDPNDVQIGPAQPVPFEPSLINCTRCDKQTTVPFQPEPDRPAYCWECLQIISKNPEAAVPTSVATLTEPNPPLTTQNVAQSPLEMVQTPSNLSEHPIISQEQLLKVLLDKSLTVSERREAAQTLADHDLTLLSQVGLMLAVGDDAWMVSWAAADTLGTAGDLETAQWLEFKLTTITDPQFQFILNRAIVLIRKRHSIVLAVTKA